MLDSRLTSSWWALRLAYGLVPVVAGLDKFTNLLAQWTDYLSPILPRALGVTPSSFMHLVGVVEVVAGLIVLSRFTRLGAYLVSAWLLLIALNLLSTGHFLDVAVRDVVMAVGAFTLGRMAEVKADARASARDASSLKTARSSA
ncbi:MAG: DoxX family membrane protein [Myxococcaceae bacterium]